MDELNVGVEVEIQDLPPVTEIPARDGGAAEPAASAPSRPALAQETLASLMRLAVGSTFLGADLVRERLQTWEAAHPAQPAIPTSEETPRDRARLAMLGLMFHAYETGRRQVAKAVQAGVAVGALGMVFVKPVVRSPLLSPARRRYEQLVNVGAARMEAWVNTGRVEEQRSRQMANDLFFTLVDEVTTFLGENEEVSGLIDEVADKLLANLAQDPQVQALIRSQGDNYLIYLQEENADQVQQLIQGQSLDLAGLVLDEVRERTVTADTVAERLVRALLRRPPRETLSPPPPEVQRWSIPQSPSAIVAADEPPAPELPPPAPSTGES